MVFDTVVVVVVADTHTTSITIGYVSTPVTTILTYGDERGGVYLFTRKHTIALPNR